MSDINIVHKLAVRNGFVEIPGKLATDINQTTAEALVLISGSTRKRQLSGSILLNQEWVVLPAFDSFSQPASDYYKTLRDA